jgi:hypothetical protein
VSAQDFTLTTSFYSDHETMEKLRAALEITGNALTAPTKQNAGELLRLGCEAVATVAQLERDARGSE